MRSIKEAKKGKGFVSINYLAKRGFSDSQKEVKALEKFIDETSIDMIQWRNLNYDPVRYFKKLRIDVAHKDMIGMDTLINNIHKKHPGLMRGYFNPSKRRIRKKQG